MIIGYKGNANGSTVTIVLMGTCTGEKLKNSHRGQQKSPTGFAWGYSGSGPAALAHSILTHFAGDGIADQHFQAFKSQRIATLKKDRPFTITDVEINNFLESVGEKRQLPE